MKGSVPGRLEVPSHQVLVDLHVLQRHQDIPFLRHENAVQAHTTVHKTDILPLAGREANR
jgi:hypothetical protein